MWALVLGRGGFEPPKALGQLIYSQSRLTASVSARPGDFTDNRRMSKRGWILWQGLINPSMELVKTARSDQGFELEWSPSTNTLPIRRLALAPGETRAVAAAWIRFPSLEVERLDQSYERLDQRRYRYRSGLFSSDLLVDDNAMVLQYGVNWKAVATAAKRN
jgi:hypothetical protein